MKTNNFCFDNLSCMDKGLDLSGLSPDTTLVQIFSGFIKKDEIKKIRLIMQEKNSKIKYIGATTSGEIFNGKSYDNKILVSVLSFEKTKVEVAFKSNKNSFLAGKELAKALYKKDTKAMIVFGGGIATNGEDIVNGINSFNPNIIVAGGMAGDNQNFNETYVFCNYDILKNIKSGCVGASLSGSQLNVYNFYLQSWDEIGKQAVITKVDKNRVYEIDGISTCEFYKKYLGKNIASNLPWSAIEFPLIKTEDNIKMCRSFSKYYEEDGSLLAAGNLNQFEKVRLGFGNVNKVLNDAYNGLCQFAQRDFEGFFIYSCVARKTFLQANADYSLSSISNINHSGFFTYGEIFHSDSSNKNLFFNIALTALGLSEKPMSKPKDDTCRFDKKDTALMKNKNFLLLNALTNLINTSIGELEDTQEMLKELSMKDTLTNLYNRRYFDEISKELIALANRKNEQLSILVLDIDNFKKINDTYGHSVGDDVIKMLSIVLQTNTRKQDIIARMGGEEFAILLPQTTISKARVFADKIRKLIGKCIVDVCDSDGVKFTVSIGVSCVDIELEKVIDSAFKRADVALYKAKNSGKNKVLSQDIRPCEPCEVQFFDI